MKKTFLFLPVLTVLFFCPVNALSQQSLPGDILTPNSMDLGRYGDIPMNYFTGRANVSIPLYETELRGVPLSISLCYDTGGLLMNSLPGWTGHGWTLNAGGCITRIQQGECDEYVFPEYYDNYHVNPYSLDDQTNLPLNHRGFRNYFQSCAQLLETITRNANPLQHPNPGIVSPVGADSLSRKIYKYQMDSSPDIFYFNFMGKSGRFILGPDKQWKIISDENLDVVFDVDDEDNYIRPLFTRFTTDDADMMPKTIKGFTLIDEKGTRYVFGGENEGDIEAIEYSIPFLGMRKDDRVPFTANAWYLKRVEDRYGKTIYEFSYRRGKYIIPVSLAYEYTEWDKIYQIGEYGGSDSFVCENSDFPFHVVVNSPVYLSQISISNGISISFSMNDTISLTSTNLYPSIYETINGRPLMNRLYDQYPFLSPSNRNHANLFPYFNPGDALLYNGNLVRNGFQFGTDDPFKAMEIRPLGSMAVKDGMGQVRKRFMFSYDCTPRLHLTGINVLDTANVLNHKYSFVYNDYDNVPSDYLTTAVDHWGLSNAPSQSYSLDYLSSLNHTTFVNTKTPSNAALNGSLKEIIYPTGGKTVFDYELHSYSLYMSEDLQRVDTVSTDGNIPYKPGIGEASDSLHNGPDSTLTSTSYIANGTAGGLRIKSIKEYDGEKLLKTRTFTYQTPEGTSSGVLFSQPRYYWPKWCLNPPAPQYNYDCYLHSTFRTTSIVPLSNSFGTHIGYSYVKETLDDGTSRQYNYSNVSDTGLQDGQYCYTYMNSSPTPFDKYVEKDFLRGKLLSETTFDHLGNEVASTEYTYEYATDPTYDYIFASNIFYISHISGWFEKDLFIFLVTNQLIYNAPLGVIYKILYPKYTVKSKTTVFSGEGESLVETTSVKNTIRDIKAVYGYPHRQRVLKVTSDTVSRQSDVVVNEYSFPLDSLTQDTCFTRDFFLPCTATTTLYNGNRIDHRRTSYGWFHTSIDSIFAASCDMCETRADDGCCIPESYDTLVTYNTYSSDGHLLRYTEKGQMPVRLLWDRNRERLLAKIQFNPQVPINENFLQSYSAIQQPAYLFPLFDRTDTNVTIYAYDAFNNVSSITSGNRQTLHYEYDSMGRLRRIKDTNGKTVKEYEYHYSTGLNQN